jgi:hypothetical protein
MKACDFSKPSHLAESLLASTRPRSTGYEPPMRRSIADRHPGPAARRAGAAQWKTVDTPDIKGAHALIIIPEN